MSSKTNEGPKLVTADGTENVQPASPESAPLTFVTQNVLEQIEAAVANTKAAILKLETDLAQAREALNKNEGMLLLLNQMKTQGIELARTA